MKPYQRGDVVIIDVPIPASGHVQGGKRPWVIVQNNMGNQFSPHQHCSPSDHKDEAAGNAHSCCFCVGELGAKHGRV
ncbi:type II toxin-antitoxin system PemK/MazF family toxin [Flavonifractor plautii]|uniref:type II toxin-antitoxin system PemK/MazF family toxin n=1 Tax=Flavonifractor plautii TaxID=292800 RepID=UPI0032EFB01E